MIYLGPAGSPFGCKSTEEGIRRVSALGLNAMEVQFVRGVKMGKETAKRVGALAKEKEVRLSAHAPYYVNLNSDEKEKIEASKKRIVQTAEIAEEMGAYIIAIHAGYYGGKTSEETTEKIKAGLEECEEETAGLKVKLGIETAGKKGAWGSLMEISKVCTKKIVPVVDFAHIHARGGGILNSTGDFEKVVGEYERIYDKFLHVHYSCINFGQRGELNHLTLDKKQPDFSFLAPVLKKKKYDITIISESPVLEQDSLRMREILEKAI